MNKETNGKPAAPSTPPAAPTAAATTTTTAAALRPKVGTTTLKSSYCNMCSVNSTREEIVLNFGINQDWDRSLQSPELSLEHRIILSPSLAKRLVQLLHRSVEDYEGRYGALG